MLTNVLSNDHYKYVIVLKKSHQVHAQYLAFFILRMATQTGLLSGGKQEDDTLDLFYGSLSSMSNAN